jgi:HK97 family phage major capsid protein
MKSTRFLFSGLRLLALAAVAIAAYHGLLPHDAGLGLAMLGVVTIQDLQARLKELHDISTGIQAKADAEKRDLTKEEQTELDSVMDEFEQVELDIKRRQRVEAQAARLAEPGQRQTQPGQVAANGSNPGPNGGAGGQPTNAARAGGNGLQNTVLSTVSERNRWGFQNMGEFAMAVRGAIVHPGSMDQRLQNAALSTSSSEGVGADGGFAVPPEWRSEIMRLVDAEDSFLSETDQMPVSGNTMSYPIDETTGHQTSGGIQVYWDGESDTITQSKIALKDLTIKLHRLTALVPMTEELLEDAPALGAYVTGKAGEKFAFKLNDSILNGTGVGQPLGVMNAPCKVTVTKEGSQTAATIHADNVSKMMARMPAQSFKRAKWYINQDCLPQIMKLGFVVASASGTVAGAAPMYQAPNGMPTMGAYGTLLGRPIEVTEACQALGTEGDIILGDMSKYLAVVKTGGVKTDVSIHLWFDQNTTAFRFVLRMNGQPWLSAPIARKNGSNTLSNFITLQTRG